MQKLLLSALILASAAFAQSPLTTTFANNNGLGTGTMMWFDLQVNTGLSITSVDVNALAGSTGGTVDFYTIPNTHVGNETSMTGWTMQGSSTVATANAAGTPTPCTFNAPFVLTPGNYGVAIAYTGGIGQAYTTGNLGPFSTAEMTMTVGGSGGIFTGIVNTPRTCNISIYYSAAGGNFALQTPYGEGCNEEYASFYENHSAFDLSGTSLTMTNTGTGYVAIAGTTAMTTPVAAPTTIGDDQVLQFPLGWTLPYPGGTTTDLWISSNGFVNLTTNALSGCCAFNLNTFLSNGPVFAAKWRDLNPSSIGTVTFESDPVAQTATITFMGVPDFGSTTDLNDFQYFFDAAGTVELRFGTCAATAGGTGYSPGAANVDPGSIDLSATPVVLVGANDVTPITLAADARPILGTTVNVTIDNIPTGTAIAGHIYGLNQNNPGIDLTGIGMPGCFQYCTQDAIALTIAPGATASNAFAVPSSTSFSGVLIYAQGAIYNPGGNHNALEALSTNGIEFVLDIN